MAGELYINSRLVDIDQSIPFPLTFNISDIKDISSRKGNKSKTIKIPGTLTNHQLFTSVFLLTATEKISTTTSGIVNFDPSIKATCQYYNNGLLEFNGIAQLMECKLNNGTWSFEITMVSDTIDYIAQLKKVKVNELDYSEYQHNLTLVDQQETWNGFNQINGVSTSIKTGADWDGIGYYYGLIDYGYSRPTPDTFAVDNIPVQTFVYGILKKIFEFAGADVSRLIPVSTSEFPRPAKRPSYSVLSHDKWRETDVAEMRDWKTALAEAMPAITLAVKTEG